MRKTGTNALTVLALARSLFLLPVRVLRVACCVLVAHNLCCDAARFLCRVASFLKFCELWTSGNALELGEVPVPVIILSVNAL